MKKSIIIFIVLILVIGGIVFAYLQNNKKEAAPELFKVVRGNVVQEVSETAIVAPAQEITLSFENSGQIKGLYVKEGQKVGPGQLLAELDSEQLEIQLSEARAAKATAQAKLNQLLAGYSKEEIQIAKTAVLNAKISLADEEQNLTDVKAQAKEDLDAVYEDALNALEDIYLNSYNAWQDVQTVYQSYFAGSLGQDSATIKENQNKIETAVDQEKSFLDSAKAARRHESIDAALLEFEDTLSVISSSLTAVKKVVDKTMYSDTVSTTHKTALDNARADINQGLTDVADYQQTIADTRLTNESNINQAQAKANTAQGLLQKAKDELALKEAGPRQVDIDLYEAEVKAADAKVNLLKAKLSKTLLKSPIEGVITNVFPEAGETVKATEPVVTLISSKPFQVEANIYEEDIGRVSVANEAAITLVAFPEKAVKGKVAAVEPAEKIIEGVVYYKVTIDFEPLPEDLNLKPGMTADIVIKTASRENVLIVPERALIKKGQENLVKVFKKEGEPEERKVEIGLKGTDDMAEVLSGLAEGEEVVLP